MDTDLSCFIDQAQRNLLTAYEIALEIGNEEQQNPDFYLGLMDELCQIRNNAKISVNARRLADELNTVEEFESVYRDECLKAKRGFNAKRLREYMDFTKKMQEIENALRPSSSGANAANSNIVQCGELVMESEVNVIDPLTKQRMVQPVRNIKCGHNYEKLAILEAISLNSRLRCPVAGCGNKDPVLPTHLNDNYTLKAIIAQMPPEDN